MGKEIERKFLIKGEGWQKGANGVSYRQGYLSSTTDISLRVRRAGDNAFLTVKGGSKGITRMEYEYEIPISDAECMLDSLCRFPLIEKTRYRIKHQGLVWEVDVFEGENRGLVLAEIEIEDESQEIDFPAWIGEEVSHDPKYYNANLVSYPYRKWTNDERK